MFERKDSAMYSKLRLLVVLGGAALLLSSSAGAVGRYTDPSGDSALAPDLTGVTVTSDESGQIEFTVAVDLGSASDAEVYLLLDTDMNGATGGPDTLGADYVFTVTPAEQVYDFARWNGSEWEGAPYSTVEVYETPEGLEISVNRSELGNAETLNFWTRTVTGDGEEGRFDDAPDDGTWNYTLAAGGPDLQGLQVSIQPASGPKAGKTFTATPRGLRLPPSGEEATVLPRPESYSCQAKLAGKALVGTGTGRCTWRLSKKARGNRLAVTMTVSYQGATKSFTFVYRVK